MVHIWPYAEEFKLRLRDCMFFSKDVKQILKIEKNIAYQTRFGITNIDSNMYRFIATAISFFTFFKNS